MDIIKLPDDKHLAGRIIDTEAAHTSRKIELGFFGRVFGTTENKSGNIAGFAVVFFSIIFAAVVVWYHDDPSLSKKDALSIVGGFITLALGFIFGKSESK